MQHKPTKPVHHLSCVLSSVNLGRLLGSYDQHLVIRLYRVGGHCGGIANRSPFSILPITSLFFTPWKGLIPYIKISHIHTPKKRWGGTDVIVNHRTHKYHTPDDVYLNWPNIQTSLAEVNLLKLMDSGAIHLIGSLPFEAETDDLTLSVVPCCNLLMVVEY